MLLGNIMCMCSAQTVTILDFKKWQRFPKQGKISSLIVLDQNSSSHIYMYVFNFRMTTCTQVLYMMRGQRASPAGWATSPVQMNS